MIKTDTAITYARSLIGTPYSELDCINLIKKIIRVCAGGDRKYTDAHVPALWDSYNSSGKYRHLIWRQESIQGARPGMLIFKGKPLGRDHQPSHIGIVASATTVIHSSSSLGGVVETDFRNGQWTLLGQSRFIEVADSTDINITPHSERDEEPMPETNEPWLANVNTHGNGTTVNLRSSPSTNSVILLRVEDKDEVVVLSTNNGWAHVQVLGRTGYIMSKFLDPAETDPEPESEPDSGEYVPQSAPIELQNASLVSETGAQIFLRGRWRVQED